MTDILQPFSDLTAILLPLIRDLITDTPHHDTGIIPVMTDQINQVSLCPLIKIKMITILTFRLIPLIETLGHHQHTHLITSLHQFWRRHIMRGTNGITTHVLEHTDLITDSRLIHRRAQRSQIVMIADTLEKKLLSIQEKALVRNQLDRTNTKSRAIGIA